MEFYIFYIYSNYIPKYVRISFIYIGALYIEYMDDYIYSLI